MADPFTKYPKTKNFFKALKSIFIARLQISILFLIILVTLSILAFNYTIPGQMPTGQAILEQQCPECICEEKECEPNCDSCPIKTKVEKENVIYYSCPGGALVENLKECAKHFPNVSEEYSGTVSGVTLSIDDIEFERDEGDSGYVTGITYTVINRGKLPIVPQLQVKVYTKWTLDVKKASPNKVINPEVVVNPNDYIKRKDKVRIFFKGEEQTLRLQLVDTLPDPDKEVLAVMRDFDLDYSD